MRAVVLLVAWLAVACSLAAASPIVALQDAAGQTTCSAFAVQPRRLLTAAHCVHGSPVTYSRDALLTLGAEQAAVVAIDRLQDWAVLEPQTPLPAFGVAEPTPGSVVIVAARSSVGSAGRLLESYFAGDVPRWAAATYAEPGWSGSPVLQHGLAVGILQSCRGETWPRKACAKPGFVTFFPAASVPL